FRNHVCRFIILSCSILLPLAKASGAQLFNDWAATTLSSVPSQQGPTDDPDNDGAPNLAEFMFGTDPLSGLSTNPAFSSISSSSTVFSVQLFEQAGHQLGLQIDLDATADLVTWIRPWWVRTTTNLLTDPPGSVRETFTAYLPNTNSFIVRAD